MTKPPMVLFAVPSYSGAACAEFLPSYIDTVSALSAAGIASGFSTCPFDPYLSKARNRLATEFLTTWTMATHLFFLDDDIGWPGAKVAEFVKRDLDLLCGVYPKKTDRGEFPAQLLIVDGKPVEHPEHKGLYRALLAPTGFMCIKRHVLERLAAASGQYFDTTKAVDPLMHFNIFDMGFFTPDGERPKNQGGVKGEFWGEDYYFVRKWRDMGGEVWIDPDVDFSHRGTKAWTGNLKTTMDAWFAQQAENMALAASQQSAAQQEAAQ